MPSDEVSLEELQTLREKMLGWSDQELIDFALTETDEDKAWEAIPILHTRGTPSTFEYAKQLLQSLNPKERELGVDILAQIGTPQKTFRNEAAELLLNLLGEEQNEDVLHSIGIALGHINDERAVEPLAALKNHPSANVRYGVAFGLSTLHTELAIQTLLELMEDEDDDVRDWATFSIGTQQNEADTPQIREALAARLTDPYWEVEAEAITGLAIRKDERAFAPVLKYLATNDPAPFVLEAAAQLGDPRLLPSLLRLKQLPEWQDDSYESRLLDEAIASCRGENTER